MGLVNVPNYRMNQYVKVITTMGHWRTFYFIKEA